MNEQETKSKYHGSNRVEQLLKKSLPRVDNLAGPVRDLWPVVQGRMEQKTFASPWFDWALAGGVAVFALVFPVAIPVFLYYL
jgi:hypothetical protein